MISIPASELVSVIPGVLGAGGNPLSLNSVFFTQDDSIPIGTVASFATLADVQDWFGPTSTEAQLASVYFAGFTGASVLPGLIYFAQFNTSDVAAYLRSGSFAGVTLAQLQAFSGTLIVTIDGRVVTSPSVNLASATSFSNAAALIQAGLQTTGSIFAGLATIDDGAGGAGNTLTITSVTQGAVHIGDTVAVTGGTPAVITAFLTGTGGLGTYTVDGAAQLVDPAAAATVTSNATVSYDSQLAAFTILSGTTGDDSTIGFATGTLATSMKFTSATGAVLSQGADTSNPAAALATLVTLTQNWALFMTVWEPLTADKVLWAEAADAYNQRYGYVGWDTSVLPTQGEDLTSFAALTETLNGRIAVWGPADKAAFICGATAAINFDETNGRTTYAYRSQSGLTADVTDATVAQNLLDNGYNFYGAYATANDQFQFLQDGQISGDWNWIDPYVNQIKLNSDLQLAFITLFTQAKSVPYVTRGYDTLRAAALDPINAALNFGSIVAGVNLSASQRQQVNTAAGASIADVLQSRGWYLQILDASAITRGQRGSPPMTLWYTDGGSIQKINLASIDVQ